MRPEELTTTCLVVASVNGDIRFPKKEVMVCGVKDCPVRSDDVGDQGVRCQRG